MISNELVDIYNFYCNISNDLEEKLEKLDSNLAREAVSFNKSHIYPIFAYNKNPGDYIIYEPHLKSEFYFNSNYFTNIGNYEYIYYKNEVDLNIFNKAQIFYNLKTNKFVSRMKHNQIYYECVYNLYDIIRFENCIVNYMIDQNLNKKYAFIINSGSLQLIIKHLIANHKDKDYLSINNTILKIYRKLLENMFIYLECYVDLDFWHEKNNYNLYLAFDIVLEDYLYDHEKICLINDTIDYEIEKIKQQFQNNTIKKNKHLSLIDTIKINIKMDEYNVNIIRSIFSVKRFIDFIITYIASMYINHI